MLAEQLTWGVREPNQFQGMLAVSGKQAVAAYYSLFKQLAPELRVAMTYSRDEANGTGASDLQAALKQAMQDYMTFYGTRNFLEDKDTQRAYLNDMTKRIARKKPYNKGNDANRLDLIIVSDQLLTGFDSKFVNIINMSSILGLVGDTMTASYNASKGAVRLFSKSAAVYAAQNDLNIRVNTVHPGLHRNAID